MSTGRALALAAGGEYELHETVDASFPFQRVRDGDHVDLGNTVAAIMHLPGHTPEHIGLVVADRSRTSEPWFVVTGHTLLVGDMGRTELASSAEVGAWKMAVSTPRGRLAPRSCPAFRPSAPNPEFRFACLPNLGFASDRDNPAAAHRT